MCAPIHTVNLVANELVETCCIETRTRASSANPLACLYAEPILLFCVINFVVF